MDQDELRALEADGDLPPGAHPGQNDGEIDIDDFHLGAGQTSEKKYRLHRFVNKLVEEE